MAGQFELLFSVDFSSSASITVTHSLDRLQVAVIVRIGDVSRNDLITTVTPLDSDPRNAVVVTLDSAQTGRILVVDTDYVFANIPSSENAGVLSGGAALTTDVYDPTTVAGDAFARGNHTGTQLASTISDFAHAASHQDGGSDEVGTATPAANAIPKADGTGSLDAWVTPGGDVTGPASSIDQGLVRFNGTTGKILEEVGLRNYGASATDPATPTPAEGDVYFNTALDMQMFYDSSRSKWLSVETGEIHFGRNGNVGAGAFYRGVDRRAFTSTIGRNAEYNGTIVSLTYTRSDTSSATFEVTANGTLITTASLLSSAVKGENLSINGDFSAGQILGVRNQSGGTQTSNIQGWVRFRWRV